jgi:hypothetical protein
MSRKNWNYKTTRNRIENNFYKGFDNGSDENYNSKVLKKYKLKVKNLTEWEKNFYSTLKSQVFNITDTQLNLLIKLNKKYKSLQ